MLGNQLASMSVAENASGFNKVSEGKRLGPPSRRQNQARASHTSPQKCPDPKFWPLFSRTPTA